MSFLMMRARWMLVAALCLLSACSVFHGAAPQPVASQSDERAYRYLQLDNGMEVLLVSDPEAEKAAASLDVNVGSRQDPRDREGLAHFLEHMLFLGTEKYPEAGEYQDYISAHGGSHNAFTAFEHTNYFFDIESSHLEPALDRFSQFFVAPLFNAAYVEREKNAVHSEYLARIKNDARKSWDVFKTVVNQKHPFSKFSVGSLQTLADRPGDPVREDLLAFYRRYYSADLMTLVVYGRESLDELERLVRPRFAPVPGGEREIGPIETPLFEQGQLPRQVNIRPEKDLRSLSIAFPLPDVTRFYREKPLHYIGNIVGHEGEGSLLSWLKENNWATALSAGEGFGYDGGTTFNVSIELTPEGESHTRAIAAAVYQTIAKIRQGGVQQWRFDEQHNIAAQRFRFQERSEPIHYVSSLAMGMHQYPPEDILRGPYRMDRYDPALIQRTLDYLRPENSLITLTSPDVQTDQVSPHYHTEYAVTELPDWQVRVMQAQRLGDAVRLPAPNPFIADDISVKPLHDPAAIPQLVVDEQGLQMWFKQAERFRVPRGNIHIGIRSPLLSDGPQNAVLAALLAEVMNDKLNEFSYPATLAGLHFSVRKHMRGLTIDVSGYDQKQAVLLRKILSALTDNDIDPQRFERVIARYRRDLENQAKRAPYRLLSSALPELLYRYRWPDAVLLGALEGLDHRRLQQFAARLLADLDIDMLMHGNYSDADAEQMLALVRETLLAGAESAAPPAVPVLQLRERLRRPVRSDHADAAALLYLQAGDLDKTRRVAMGLSAHMMRSDFYTSLRTEKQLGYIVMAGAYPVWDVPGMLFLVQSPVAGPVQLREQIEGFVAAWAAQPEAALQGAFATHKQAMIQRLAEQPKNLAEATDRYWADIAQGYDQFDSREQLLHALRDLDFETWRTHFHSDVVTTSRQLYLYTKGKFGPAEALEGDVIDDISAFKQAQRYYRFD